MSKRDPNDFSEPTKRRVLERAGFLCSAPNCPVHFYGAHADPDSVSGSVYIGEVAHIQGARPANNNRYSVVMTPEQRSHHSNAIALCRNHAKIIDSDEDFYTVELLHEWKSKHEAETPKLKIPEPDNYPYEKPFGQCSSDELYQDRERRKGLLKEELKNRGIALLPIILGILAVWILFKIIATFYTESPLWLAIIMLGTILILVSVLKNLSEDSDFEKHQRQAVNTIEILLKDRGEKI